ncbi:MAG TPA: alpha/beta hydrolase [Flavobacteriales bacterium]|nr:alpha/beta hydrolase [Flavobacteriales bacterium]
MKSFVRVIFLLAMLPFFLSLYKSKETVTTYPYPVKHLTLIIEQQDVKMAFMDVEPEKPNGKSVVLLHGKNFNGYYWKETIEFLTKKGYRVIVPDQVGWGKSDKPDIHYSFHLLAYNTKQLLNRLNVEKAIVIGHSMGGMVAARFALMYPESVEKLVLENPIGLEDYKVFVPYESIDRIYEQELNTTYASLLEYQKTYYPEWKDEYEELVKVQSADLLGDDFKRSAWANALTYQMIYEQPVCYEFKYITVPTLMLAGNEDHTILGKGKLSEQQKSVHGRVSKLAREASMTIRDCRYIELKGVGHLPHIQTPSQFHKELDAFLKK